MQFLDAKTPIGTATLSNGVATLVTQLPRPGSRTITAQYQGSATHESSVSNGVAVTVTSVANNITLSYSPAAPYTPGNPITIIATVNGCVLGNGQITFQTVGAGSISSIPTATVQLSGRTASTTFTAGYGRNYSFRATLTGDTIATNNIYADGSFDVIWSSAVTITGATPNPVAQQQPTTFSATVTGNQPVGQYPIAATSTSTVARPSSAAATSMAPTRQRSSRSKPRAVLATSRSRPSIPAIAITTSRRPAPPTR